MQTNCLHREQPRSFGLGANAAAERLVDAALDRPGESPDGRVVGLGAGEPKERQRAAGVLFEIARNMGAVKDDARTRQEFLSLINSG